MSYEDDNVFAKILRGELPAERVYEDDHTVAIMDIMPRCDGHVLVIPKTPARNILDATPEQLAACMTAVQRVGKATMKAFDAPGLTIQQFNEEAGGQVVFHLHFHVLPRQSDERLRPHFRLYAPERKVYDSLLDKPSLVRLAGAAP